MSASGVAVFTPQGWPGNTPAGWILADMSRRRLLVARALVVLAAILAIPAAFAGYVRWQALDTSTFRDTARELIADDVVRDQIAAGLVDALYTNVDVAASLQVRLPPEQQQLAEPIAAGFRTVADRLAQQALDRPRVEELWVNALAGGQERLLRVLEDEGTALQTEDGSVVLNLRPLVVALGERVGIVEDIESRLPPDAGQITIMEAGKLETAQDLTNLLRVIGNWFWLVPVLLFAAGVGLAKGRRRLELRAVAISAIVIGVVLFTIRSVAGRLTLDALVQTETARPAADQVWSILTALLADTAWTLIGIGVIALAGVWLAGESSTGRATRRALAPVLGRRSLAFGTAGTLFLIVLWWSPTAQTERAPQMLVAAILLAIAVEALHRATVRDFPDEAALAPGEGFRSVLARLRSRRRPHAGNDRVSDLERLVVLRDSGGLSASEFAEEKARLHSRH